MHSTLKSQLMPYRFFAAENAVEIIKKITDIARKTAEIIEKITAIADQEARYNGLPWKGFARSLNRLEFVERTGR